jgi:hypothetical protein
MGRNLKTSEPEEILRKGLSQMRTADEDIPVPEDLSRMIGRTVDRELGRRRGRMRLVASISSVAAAAAIAAVALIVPVQPSQPEDTFDTPEEAYAAVIEAFGLIGQNIDMGLSYADNSIDDVKKSAEGNLKSVIRSVSPGNNAKTIEK